MNRSEFEFETIGSIFNHLEKGVWEVDSKGLTLYANHWICEELGYSLNEFLKLDLTQEIRKANHTDEPWVSLSSYLRNKSPWYKQRFLSKSGRVKFLSVKQIPDRIKGDSTSFTLLLSTRFLYEEQTTHFETIQSMGDIGIWELDPVTGQTFWSKQVYAIYGIDPTTPTDKIQGINFYAPEDQAKIAKDVEAVLNGQSYRGTYKFIDATGVQKWVEAMGQPVLNNQGQVILVRGTFQDVTERIRREQNLSLVLNNINEGYWDWHVPKDYEFMSPRFWEILGYDHRTKKAHPSEWQSLIHQDDLPMVYQSLEAHIQSKGQAPFLVKVRYRHGKGHWVWIRCAGRVVEWDPEGKPLRVVGTHQDITEELNLARENEGFLTALNATMVISKTDTDGIITYANDLFCQISKYSRDELVGQNHRIIKSGVQDANFFDELWSVISNKQIFRGEICNRAKDGSHYWVDATILPLLDSNGDILEYIAFRHIITEQKQAEIKLKESAAKVTESKQRLELAIESANLGTWSWDLRNNKVVYDEKWAELRGADFASLTHTFEDWSSRVHPEDLAKAHEDIQNYLSGKSTGYSNLHRVKHSDGQWRHILGSGRFADWDQEGNPIRFVGTDMDMTDTVLREQVTRLVSDLRLHFIDLSGDSKKFFDYVLSVLIKHFESEYGFIGEIRQSSDGAPYLKTFSITDISWDKESKAFFETHAPEGLEFRNLNSLFGEVIRTAKPLVTNDPGNHPKKTGTPHGHPPLKAFMGIPIFYNHHFIAMVGLANRPGGFTEKMIHDTQGIFEAIGEMINSIKLNAEIESQKQYALHNSKLASIGEMAAGVGHEINNPLAIILGQLTILKKHTQQNYPQDELIFDRIQKAQRAVDRVANIVQGLRSFSRSDQGAHTIFNFSVLAHETADMLVELYRNDEISFDVQIQDSLWTQGSRGRWQQVLVNLLNNARDAVVTTDIKKIELHLTKGEKEGICLLIRDSGVGIPDHLKQKIFEPFFTTKEVNKGTGIGLALTNSIVQEHGSRLYLDSKIGEGTLFRIEIPAASAPVSSSASTFSSSSNSSVSPSPSSQPSQTRILVVDDEEDLREALEDILKSFGYQVIVAPDGQQALDRIKAEAKTIDVVLSDMKMPKLDGPGLLSKVRSETDYRGLFFFITGGVKLDLKEFEDQVDGFLSKPFEESEVLQLIQSKLESQRGGQK